MPLTYHNFFFFQQENNDSDHSVSNTWIRFAMGVHHLCGTFNQFEKIPKRTISFTFDWEHQIIEQKTVLGFH